MFEPSPLLPSHFRGTGDTHSRQTTKPSSTTVADRQLRPCLAASSRRDKCASFRPDADHPRLHLLHNLKGKMNRDEICLETFEKPLTGVKELGSRPNGNAPGAGSGEGKGVNSDAPENEVVVGITGWREVEVEIRCDEPTGAEIKAVEDFSTGCSRRHSDSPEKWVKRLNCSRIKNSLERESTLV